MLLTAGLGRRLAPLSDLKAKPALPVAGVPLAGRILRWLAGGGVTDAVLNLHHLPASVTEAIGDGSAFGVRVRYSWEPRILGSAGGPARALPLLDAEQFFLVNGDTLTDLDLAALAARHSESGASVTLAVVRNPDPLHYGGVVLDDEGRVTGFSAPGPANRGWHFIGVQAVNGSVFAGLNPDEPASNGVGDLRRDDRGTSRRDPRDDHAGVLLRHRDVGRLPRDVPRHRTRRGPRRCDRRRPRGGARGSARHTLRAVG